MEPQPSIEHLRRKVATKVRQLQHEFPDNKEDYLKKYASLNKKFNEYKNKISKLQKEYAEENAEYKVGDVISANGQSGLEDYVCSSIVVNRKGEFDYKFKKVGSTLLSYSLNDLTDVQRK